MSKKICDFLIVGGGVVGLSVARELRKRSPKASICVLEKEGNVGVHASGRNSGVIHAGFYYSPDSMKAKFTRSGNLDLHQFCDEAKIPVNRCGKLVVAGDEKEEQVLDVLAERGRINGVPLTLIDKSQAADIEPRAKTYRRALWSPSTSSINPRQVLDALVTCLKKTGSSLSFGETFVRKGQNSIQTNKGTIEAGMIINCAGTYADAIAKQFGMGRDYVILPFKGLFIYAPEANGAIRTHVYPVPDLSTPFLGVHVTIGADGKTKYGPTAIPALWNEHYQGLKNFRMGEFLKVASAVGRKFLTDGEFRRLARSEIRKLSRPFLLSQVSRLISGVDLSAKPEWGPSGIRAQLVHKPTKSLVMDFVVEGDKRSLHVLNAVSPAFTCAFPFSRHLCDRIFS